MVICAYIVHIKWSINMSDFIRIGTRSSQLSLIQANQVSEALYKLGFKTEIHKYKTSGDRFLNSNLYDIGGKGLFLKEIEEALWRNEIDIAVHSLKDCPGILDRRFDIAAMLKRSDPRDVLVTLKGLSIVDLPSNAIIGTCSPRRRVQVLKLRSDLDIKEIRGSVETRLKKLFNQEYDAIILAASGLHRLGLFNKHICTYLDPSIMLPAVGQGVIAIEIRKHDQLMRDIVSVINHAETMKLANIEREYLASLEASCNSPVAAYAKMAEGAIIVYFLYADYNMEFYKKFSTHIGDNDNLSLKEIKRYMKHSF